MTAHFRVAYQGEAGAYSDLAAEQLFPQSEKSGCQSFRDVLISLDEGKVDYALIPVTNSTAGPVTTAVELLQDSDYTVERVFWLPIRHSLLVLPGTRPSDIKTVHSHWQALRQCARNITATGFTPVEEPDTAGAAHMIASEGDKSKAAIASARAGEVYGLETLEESFEDVKGNKTLFLALKRHDANNPNSVKKVLKDLGLRVAPKPAETWTP